MATHGPNLECRMCEAKYLEIDRYGSDDTSEEHGRTWARTCPSLSTTMSRALILFSELSPRRIRSISSHIKVGCIGAIMVLHVDRGKRATSTSASAASPRRVILVCKERYNKSKLVPLHQCGCNGIECGTRRRFELNFAKASANLFSTLLCLNVPLASHVIADLYVHIGWPLYRKYGLAFEAANKPEAMLAMLLMRLLCEIHKQQLYETFKAL
ncbi:hypothetical protein NL676_005063 [Syzygium grande]|nr:hypothetical protein NL676_005063 [Syzygium grande]